MPITIIGSWREDVNSGTLDEFAKACNDIGRKLAHAEQQVIVASERQHTADYHIVQGIVEEAAENRELHPLIHIIRPREGDIFQDLWRKHGRLFTQHGGGRHSSEAATIISARDADAVLTIGGRKRTYRVGLAAIVASKRLVPIGSFRGASLDLINDIDQYGIVTNQQVKNTLGSLSGPWSSYVRDTALDLAGVTKPPTVLIIHGHSTDRILLRDWIQTEVGLSITDLPMMGEEWGSGRTLPEKFEDLAAEVDAAIAIATPDDVGGLNGEETRQRARQNVWLEVGWFWGRLGRKRVMLLCKGDIEFPSDLRGIEFYPYTTHPEEAGTKIRQFVSRIQSGG